MAGGMVLMAILVTMYGVAQAMVLHGFIQATSNGSRAWILRHHINWQILPLYLIGAALAIGLFTLVLVVPPAGVVLILVGLFPWLARLSKHLKGLDITKPLTTLCCGFFVTAAQLLAGASGPLLDVFYLNSPMTRQEIVANKALTQTLGHIFKIVYYGLVVAVGVDFSWWLVAIAMLFAVLGTRVGTLLLDRWNDAQFQKISQVAILTIATLCTVQGIRMLLN